MVDEELALSVLLGAARKATVRAMRDSLEAIGCDDLPPRGTFVLGALRRSPDQPVNVAEWLGVSKQAASQLVDAMVTRGFLTREAHPDDRRRINLVLTERGRLAAEETRAALVGVEQDLVAAIGAEAVTTMRSALTTLAGL